MIRLNKRHEEVILDAVRGRAVVTSATNDGRVYHYHTMVVVPSDMIEELTEQGYLRATQLPHNRPISTPKARRYVETHMPSRCAWLKR